MSAIKTKEFSRIADIAMDKWGLHLTDKKRSLVENRLAKFLMRTQYNSVAQYLDHLEHEADEEDMLVFFDLLSTNVTSFFRDKPHFDYLEREFYTPLARGNTTLPGKRIRIWSAACSTGMEPYSLAINAVESLPNLDSWDFKILATDLSNTAVAGCKLGVYRKEHIEPVPAQLRSKYFTRVPMRKEGEYQICPELREKVFVNRLNLMESWPVSGPFDVIFCRNVMIYFDKPTRERLVQRFTKLLRPGGIFAVGSAETVQGLDVQLRSVQPSVYVKAG
ncbi:MAG: CheR family methyltransferase [Planctomycetota bacterium]|jgi:chemotaxis protein methyltransferase CheR